jgi:hypothetical protein
MTDSPDTVAPREPSAGDEIVRPAVQEPSAGGGMGALWVCCILAGIVAGLLSWLGGEATYQAKFGGDEMYGWFPPELREGKDAMGRPAMVPTKETMDVATTKTGLLAAAWMGGILGLSLGVAGGCARRSHRAAVWAGLLGLVLGSAAGLGATLALIKTYINSRGEGIEEVPASLLIHMGIWSAIGGGAGLALGLGLKDKSRALRALLGGAVGAALGAALYEIVGCVIFPLAKTTQLISVTAETRLLARLSVCVLAALGTIVFIMPSRPKAAKEAPSELS